MTRTEDAWDELERAWSVYEDTPEPEDGEVNYLGMLRYSLRRMFHMRIPIEAIDMITTAVNSAYAYAHKDAPEIMLLLKHASLLQEILRDSAYKRQAFIDEWIDGALESRGLPSVYEIKQETGDFEMMSLLEWVEKQHTDGILDFNSKQRISEKIAKLDDIWSDFEEFRVSLERLKGIVKLDSKA